MLDAQLKRSKFHESQSGWLRSFALNHVRCLVICRGPVRKEAFDVFDEVGIADYGMLLSEKDSIVYPRSLAPELRSLRNPVNVHRVPDYTAAGPEKQARIQQIIEIAKSNGYTHIFAGYGFMAEDAELIEAIEQAGLSFAGPGSHVAKRAGAKDEAKRLARGLGNAVVPGVDDVAVRALVTQYPERAALESLAKQHDLAVRYEPRQTPADYAVKLLDAAYAAGVELSTIEELQHTASVVCAELWKENPGYRVRFKHVAGGGGKGQRIASEPHQVAAAVMDILAESKALEPGSNRNFLIELNIETTRHNEIQLLGNGDWCISLGGRDCSVQMHEQKLVEVSLTREELESEIARASGTLRTTLEGDLGALLRMEEEAERFGAAAGLDSVSTFECAVDGFRHYFMEMNTRIQVEHGVTELVYRLRFENPDQPGELFYVDRLIEAMLLCAVHGKRLPKPQRVALYPSGVEIRVNATNAALQPHAGGVIRGWSPLAQHEIRFDQGIGTPNPDTGSFIYYHVAGAYDSNVALLLTYGDSREHSYARLCEILRCTEIRGDDVQTNLVVLYGLLSWMLGQHAMVKPSTRFMTSYLAGVGSLQSFANEVDLELAIQQSLGQQEDPEARAVLSGKSTLIVRPLERLLADPHLLAGFIGRFAGALWHVNGDRAEFAQNPIHFLDALYRYLHMEWGNGRAACDMIWDHDEETLSNALAFYRRAHELAEVEGWEAICKLFEGPRHPRIAATDETWRACVAAHRGFQLGLELLLIVPRIGITSGFSGITVNESLDVVFPDRFKQAEAIREQTRHLTPPPKASSDQIVTPMGGAFFSREAPHLPPLLQVGDHFKAGQPLFIIEVMKMFNKVLAPFSGRVLECLLAGKDGAIVRKGQSIFRIEPDARIEPETPEQIRERRSRVTLGLMR